MSTASCRTIDVWRARHIDRVSWLAGPCNSYQVESAGRSQVRRYRIQRKTRF